MSSVSLVMIVKNESQNIARCLNSIQNVVDEIVVVDTGSTDETKEIALTFGAKIYDFLWVDDFSAARNFALNKATSDWILVLDADEYLDKGSSEIRSFISNNKRCIGRLSISSLFFEGNEDKISNSFVSRLFPRGVYFKGRVHEQISSALPRVNTEIHINHDGYYKNTKVDRNLCILLKELSEFPIDPYILYQVAKQYKLSGDNSSAIKYFENAYLNCSAQEYYHPLLVVDYLYSLVKLNDFEKGLYLITKEKLNLEWYTDFHFACGIFYMELVFSNVNKYINYFHLIEGSFNRCLEIGEMVAYDSIRGTGSYLALYNLGAYNQSLGNIEKARLFYKEAAILGHKNAEERLVKLN